MGDKKLISAIYKEFWAMNKKKIVKKKKAKNAKRWFPGGMQMPTSI